MGVLPTKSDGRATMFNMRVAPVVAAAAAGTLILARASADRFTRFDIGVCSLNMIDDAEDGWV